MECVIIPAFHLKNAPYFFPDILSMHFAYG
jgi:hypothetical protein